MKIFGILFLLSVAASLEASDAKKIKVFSVEDNTACFMSETYYVKEGKASANTIARLKQVLTYLHSGDSNPGISHEINTKSKMSHAEMEGIIKNEEFRKWAGDLLIKLVEDLGQKRRELTANWKTVTPANMRENRFMKAYEESKRALWKHLESKFGLELEDNHTDCD